MIKVKTLSELKREYNSLKEQHEKKEGSPFCTFDDFMDSYIDEIDGVYDAIY